MTRDEFLAQVGAQVDGFLTEALDHSVAKMIAEGCDAAHCELFIAEFQREAPEARRLALAKATEIADRLGAVR